MEEELLSLKWNNHQKTFLQIISNLRTKDDFADATLACNGRFYSVHRFVLSTCSAYFGSIFDQIATKNSIIILKDITCSTLEYLLDYMYSGEINIRQNDLASLITAAECLRIKGLAVAEDENNSCILNNSQSCKPLLQQKLPKHHCSLDETQLPMLKKKKELSTAKKQNANLKKFSYKEIANAIPNHCVNSNNDPLPLNYNDSSENLVKVKQDEVKTKVKLEFNEGSNLLDNEDWVEESLIKYEEGSHLGLEEFANDNSISTDIRIDMKDDTFNVPPLIESHAPFSEKSLWGSDQSNFPHFENNSSSFSSCISEIQEIPEYITNQPQQNFTENSGFLLSAATDVSRHKYLFKKFESLKNRLKGYRCKQCSYTCPDGSNFKRHLQTHTGEKPYKCFYCSYRCIHSSNLKSHIRCKHSQSF